MLDGPRLARSIPRLASPRARLGAGSVGVSGFQSIIYNAPSPGGWRIIGRTPAVLFDLDRPPHVAYRPGDRLRFVPIASDDWESWRRPLEVDQENGR
jgi:allophanate hydrolase subunit 1